MGTMTFSLPKMPILANSQKYYPSVEYEEQDFMNRL